MSNIHTFHFRYLGYQIALAPGLCVVSLYGVEILRCEAFSVADALWIVRHQLDGR